MGIHHKRPSWRIIVRNHVYFSSIDIKSAGQRLSRTLHSRGSICCMLPNAKLLAPSGGH